MNLSFSFQKLGRLRFFHSRVKSIKNLLQNFHTYAEGPYIPIPQPGQTLPLSGPPGCASPVPLFSFLRCQSSISLLLQINQSPITLPEARFPKPRLPGILQVLRRIIALPILYLKCLVGKNQNRQIQIQALKDSEAK